MKTIRRSAINIRGIRTGRKLVVIESDDWGSIRMPSREVYEQLQAEGFEPKKDPYLRYDALESNEDMEELFRILDSVRDAKGRPAVLTANAVVANPDFEKIEASGFDTYHYEPFTRTLERYEGRDKVYASWKDGMARKLFIPQFHGREHLHVMRWMADLKAGDPLLRKAFEHRMISISSQPSRMKFAYMEGMDHATEAERLAKAEVLQTGHNLFRELTGRSSKTFIANCYIWDETVEEVLKKEGVVVMQGILNQIRPSGNGTHQLVKHYMGQQRNGMHYSIRNVFFEPSLDPGTDWVNEALERIGLAFFWKKPAVIGSHRLNYIGAIVPENRARNLTLMGELLRGIVKRWPDVEFISSDELADVMVS